MRTTRWAAAAAVGVAGVALAACGSSGGSYGSSSKSTTTTKAATSSAARSYGSGSSTTASTGGTAVMVRMTSLGNVLTNSAGRTLYLYKPDTGATSQVPAGVLAAWPPLVAKGTPSAGTGLDAAKVTVATQPNGAKWVAYNGHLLYTYVGDNAAGDTTGQGLGGVWYVVSPQGNAITS